MLNLRGFIPFTKLEPVNPLFIDAIAYALILLAPCCLAYSTEAFATSGVHPVASTICSSKDDSLD